MFFSVEDVPYVLWCRVGMLFHGGVYRKHYPDI